MITLFYWCVCVLIVCQRATCGNKVREIRNDSPEASLKLQSIRYKVGSDIKLRCNAFHYSKENITWEFKPCETNHKGVIVDEETLFQVDENDSEWKKLDCNKGKKKLEIRNCDEKDIGVYRCLYNGAIVKIYIVNVMRDVFSLRQPGKSSSWSPPEVISLTPSNSTVAPNTNLVIQCRARSVMPPEIRWFKECKGCDIYENNHCYCSVPSSNFVHAIEDTIYLSKLNIYNVRPVDSGIYTCFVMSLYGKDDKNVTIKVQSSNKAPNTRKSFSLLFLIPIGFILVPIIVWLCYYRRKRKQLRIMNDQQKKLINTPTVQVEIVLDENKVN